MTRPHDLTTYVAGAGNESWKLAWGERRYGPRFKSAEAATSFLEYVGRQTGLDAHHQSEATLARFHAMWEGEREKAERKGKRA